MATVKNGKIHTRLTLPAEIYEEIEKIANEMDRSRAWVMTNAVTDWVNFYTDSETERVVKKSNVVSLSANRKIRKRK